MESSVAVLLRVRPLLGKELELNSPRDVDDTIYSHNNQTVHVKTPSRISSLEQSGLSLSGDNWASFEFDKVYGAKVDQLDIFKDSVEPLLEYFYDGINCTLLCYGQVAS